MRNRIFLLAAAIAALCLPAFSQVEFTPDSIKGACKRVAKAQLKSTLGNGWQDGTYFEGVMALYYMTKDSAYLDSTIAWGKFHNWISSSGDSAPTNSDNVGCYQAYLEAYMQRPLPANAAWIAAPIVYVNRYTYQLPPSWPIVDQYHMSASNFPRVAAVTKDSVILDSLYKFCTTIAMRHYNVKDSLFNSNCSDTSQPRDSYWGRGCGWGVMAQCRILQMLPRNHYSAPWYKEKLRAVLYRLLRVQNQTDGMWRSDLLNHPEWNKEASCTGFFAFGYFYAIRNGIIDSATFIGPAKKAWKGLLDCIGADPAQPNRIGWSQGVGGSASNNFDATNHDDYTEGGFFLAGNEFYRLLTEGIDKGAVSVFTTTVSPVQSPVSTIRMLGNAGSSSIIIAPSGATHLVVYSCAGQKLFETRVLQTGKVTLPVNLQKSNGMLIAKFY
ncbi:MAG TPA: glycoside hydrolase family 88 protein [Chitinivibrionales bacterium]|nr:glycoside hydrolase family 88 protein [Chitinivibrionales bacterium]